MKTTLHVLLWWKLICSDGLRLSSLPVIGYELFGHKIFSLHKFVVLRWPPFIETQVPR